MKTLLPALAALLLAPGASPQGTVLHEFPGNEGEGFGWSVAGLGDLNGDGKAEVAVGTSNGWPVHVYSGADGSILHTLTGGSYFGASIASIGDVDGDAVPDFVVGAEGCYSASCQPGFVRAFSGASGGELFTANGSFAEFFGSRVSSLGDVSGDGIPDVLVGAPGVGGIGMGRAALLSGANGAVIRSVTNLGAGDNCGRSVAGLGDVNGDGVPDYAVGANNDQTYSGTGGPGSVFVRSGVDDEILEGYWGSQPGNAFGWACANAGDLTGDGVAEVIVGAIGLGTGGTAKIFRASSSTPLRTLTGTIPGAHFGVEVAGLGDVNGDGFGDVAVASDLVNGGGGQVKVFCGLSGATIFTVTGAPGDLIGPVAAAGDVNGDGVGDLIVGAWGGDYARVYSLAGVGSCSGSISLRGRILFQRTAAEPDPDASGKAELRIQGESQTFTVQTKKLDALAAASYGVFLEESAGSGVFALVANLTETSPGSGSWNLSLAGSGTAPAQLGVTNLASLAGRRIELRADDGTVVLWAVLPSLSGGPNTSLAGILAPTPAAPLASGKTKLQSKAASGSSKVEVRAAGLPVGPVYTLWIADGTEGSRMVLAGELVKGKFRADTKKGDPLPAGAPTAAALSGRAVEVRDGATVVLSGLLP